MDAKKSIFTQESMDKVSSPEQLDEYIRVSKPSIWIVLCAFFILAVSVIVWGFMGTLPQTLTVSGLLKDDNSAICYVSVNQLDKNIVGCKVQIVAADGTALSGVVSAVSANPLSAEEIAADIRATQGSDWLITRLVADDYAYAVTVKISGSPLYIPGTIADVTLITEEVKPISFILN
jgi:hypothetical protein